MLDQYFKYSPANAKYARDDDYRVHQVRDKHWGSGEHRLLVILGTVDSEDLKNNRLLHDRSRTVLQNTLKEARNVARGYLGDSPLPEFQHAVINFNQAKTFHLKGEEREAEEDRFALRCREMIVKLKPTHILISGDVAMRHIFPSVPHSLQKKGWVHDLEVGGLQVKVTSTLDLERLYSSPKPSDKESDDDEGQGDSFPYVNLLGYVIRNIANLYLGYHPHDLSYIKPNARYVSTIEEFDKLLKLLWEKPYVGVDTETKNLSVLQNKIFTIQFAFSEKRGYVLPLYHPLTPFSKEDLRYIRKELRRFFKSQTDLKTLIFFNGMYDLRVIRHELNLPIIYHRAWELTGGESLLDENTKSLVDFAMGGKGNTSSINNLRNLFTHYNNDFYFDSSTGFTKEDRNTTGSIPPDDPDFLKYCFSPNTLVVTDKGRVPISQISESIEDYRVLSYDHHSGDFEFKQVYASVVSEPAKPMVEIEYEGGSVRVTEDHEFWSVTRNSYVQAKDLTPDDELLLGS